LDAGISFHFVELRLAWQQFSVNNKRHYYLRIQNLVYYFITSKVAKIEIHFY